MARLVRNRLTGGLLLAVYLLSTTAASLFHDHSRPLDGACSHGACSHDEHSGHELSAGLDVHALDTQTAEQAGVAGSDRSAVQHSEQSTDDACVVCRFLGLSSLPTAVASLPASPALVAMVKPVEPRHDSRPPELTLHSRAPPQVV